MGQSRFNERKWTRIGLEPVKSSLNPHQAESMITAVVAVRSDGMQFRIEGQIWVEKLKLLPGPKPVVGVTLQLVSDLLGQLESYRQCQCTQDVRCSQHGGGTPS